MNKIIKGLLLAIFCSCFSLGYAQEARIIEGVVQEMINGKREPSIGINVVVSNDQNRTFTGTVTDTEGRYVLRIPENTSGKLKIVFSFIGMKSQTFEYKGQKKLDVFMQEETHMLQDVVITARRVESELGITTREQTYASQKIKMGDIIETLPITSVEEALQGKVTGLDILTGGDPGSKSSIRIRGTATLNTKTDPLIVINGVPYSTDIDDTFDFNTANDEDFAAMLNLNPNDIEAIEVLKDAASTSIYGTAGANGVLLITTKKGARGKTSFTVSSKNSIKFEPDPMPMLNGNQYVAFIQDAIWNTANAQGLAKSGDLLDLLFDTPEINYMTDWRYFNEYNVNTDWLDLVKKDAFTTDNSFSMSGGGEKATYRLSMAYTNEGGTTVGTGLQRLTSSLNIGYYFSDKLRVESEFSYANSDKDDNWSSAVRSEALRKMPNKSPYWMTTNADGELVQSGNYFTRQNSEEFQGAFSSKDDGSNAKNFHPLIMANESFNKSNIKEERIIVRLKYNILPGFDYDAYVSMKFKTTKNRKFLPQSATDVSSDSDFANRSTDAYSNNLALLTENKLLFRKNWNDIHNLVATGIWRTTQSSSSNYSSEVYGVASSGSSDPVNGGAVKKLASSESDARTLSGIANLNYTFLNRYVISGTVNYEGKSSLGKSNRWGTFPSMGLAWYINEEPFLKGQSKWLGDTKIRFSYGQSGNAPDGTAPYVGTYSSVGKYITGVGVAPATIQLNNLKWETSTEYNVGADLSFFDNKLTMTLDYYQKYTKDLLQKDIVIPSSTGYEGSSKGSKVTYYNSGEVSNKGWEYRVDYNVFQNKDWRVATSFNISRNINEIEVLPENLTAEAYSLKNGEYAQKLLTGTPIGSFFGYKYQGVYQNKEETYARDAENNIMYDLEGSPIVMKNGKYICYPGDAKYEDINHDGVIDAKDIVYIGNCMPVVYGSVGANATYKNLTLNLNFFYRAGQKVINETRMNSESMIGSDNQSTAVLRRWRNEGDNTDIPRALWNHGLNYLGSDRFVDDASYFRLQSVSLNYRVPKSICSQLSLRSLSVFFTVYDAFTWTKYNGQDPEVNLPSKVTDLAKDKSQTPRSARYSLGFNLNF